MQADLHLCCSCMHEAVILTTKLGAIAQAVAISLGNQEAPRSILASGTSFHESISTAILPLPLIQEEHLSVNGEKMCT